jgi:hypothetical protein
MKKDERYSQHKSFSANCDAFEALQHKVLTLPRPISNFDNALDTYYTSVVTPAYTAFSESPCDTTMDSFLRVFMEWFSHQRSCFLEETPENLLYFVEHYFNKETSTSSMLAKLAVKYCLEDHRHIISKCHAWRPYDDCGYSEEHHAWGSYNDWGYSEDRDFSEDDSDDSVVIVEDDGVVIADDISTAFGYLNNFFNEVKMDMYQSQLENQLKELNDELARVAEKTGKAKAMLDKITCANHM